MLLVFYLLRSINVYLFKKKKKLHLESGRHIVPSCTKGFINLVILFIYVFILPTYNVEE